MRAQRLPGDRGPPLVRLLQHQAHVGQDLVRVLDPGAGIRFAPECIVGHPEGGDEAVFLQVAGGQGAVEVVDQRRALQRGAVHGSYSRVITMRVPAAGAAKAACSPSGHSTVSVAFGRWPRPRPKWASGASPDR